MSMTDITANNGNADDAVAMIVPTISEDEQQGKRRRAEHLSMIPRSVRWRIQLGLLTDPTFLGKGVPVKIKNVLECNREKVKECDDLFKELVKKYLEEAEEVDKTNGRNTGSKTEVDIDPLTSFVKEEEARESKKAQLYLKYRKERARRKRGLSTEARFVESESDEVDRDSLIIIEKDLKRLPHPTETKQPISNSSIIHNSTPENEARITSLREILYIYAQEHPTMGYRQGMHEIASYLLFVLEIEHEKYPDENPLFTPILPICYAMFERTMGQLKTAYDASGSEKSLQAMSIAILGKILQNNPPLYHHLTNNPHIPPPPIYCTRWVRLMFSREVVGYENVFKLWDVLFSYDNIMRALEITCSSRILLLSDLLLDPENNSLDLLMNVSPLEDIDTLTNALQELMKQKENDRPIPLAATRYTVMPSSGPGPQNYQNLDTRNQQLSPQSEDDSKFSFHKMKQSLGQKGESLRKKIITTTFDWKEATSKLDISSSSFDHTMSTVTNSNNKTPRGYNDYTSSHTNLMPDGPSATGIVTPKQHQHEMWSQLLQQKVWILQKFLIDLESKENKGKVPDNVWVALADMDRMQRELLNYSRSSMGDRTNQF